MASFLSTPTSFRLAQMAQDAYDMPFVALKKPHDSHPSIPHLVLLVFEAVLEVVCVSLPGYIVARLGHFDADKQKFLANLNVMLFTPCLIFTKLASQLNADKLAELAIIPVIFIIQTCVSWLVATLIARAFGFNRRASNFVTAMGVFGNSNSLPISLVLSLSQTLKGLHWDRIPGDNDDEVGARGILYLLIFQQLGQLVRWSWGYHVLLAPKEKYPEYQDQLTEEGGRSAAAQVEGVLIPGLDGLDRSPVSDDADQFEPAGRTPIASGSRTSLAGSDTEFEASEVDALIPKKRKHNLAPLKPANQRLLETGDDEMSSFPEITGQEGPEIPVGIKGYWVRAKVQTRNKYTSCKTRAVNYLVDRYDRSPPPVQRLLLGLRRFVEKMNSFIWDFMNPPLWAMLMAVIVASVPDLQRLFFQEGSFIKNSVTSAVQSSGGVAVPLILVVLGANLARNTQKRAEHRDPEEEQIGRNLMIASLVSRMVLPTLIMAPILALFAKYVPISILDDPIFVIVCFLLTGAPSALQLAQICQINEVYEGVMGKILFQSYVIWILPSTLVLVMCALEVVEWAK